MFFPNYTTKLAKNQYDEKNDNTKRTPKDTPGISLGEQHEY